MMSTPHYFFARTRLVHLLLAVLCVLFSAAPVLAQPGLSDPLAQDLKNQGDASMDAGNYEAALDAYTRATSIENSPILLYNRGRALQALERFPEALAHLEAFRRDAPDELKERVPGLDRLLAGIRNQVTRVSVHVGVAEATVTLDDNEIFIGPESSATSVNAGTVVLKVTAKGYEPYKKTLRLPGGEDVTVAVKLVPQDRTGLLRITSLTTGATVLVDGKKAGMVPAELALTSGRHKVDVTHPKHVPFTTQIVVQPKSTRTLDVELEERPGLLKKWWFWASVGAVVAAGTATVIVATSERRPDEGDIPPGQVSAPTMMQVSF